MLFAVLYAFEMVGLLIQMAENDIELWSQVLPRDQYFLSQRSALETYLTIGIEAAIWPLSCIGETTDIARQEKKTLRWLVVADLVWSKYADPPVDGGCADVVDKGAEIKGPDLQVFVGDHLKLGHKHISRFRFFRSKNSSKHRISRSQLKRLSPFSLPPPLHSSRAWYRRWCLPGSRRWWTSVAPSSALESRPQRWTCRGWWSTPASEFKDWFLPDPDISLKRHKVVLHDWAEAGGLLLGANTN